jgi:hypothetical protein
MKFLFNRELSLLCLSIAGLVSFQVVLPSPSLAQLGGEPVAEAIEVEADAVIPPLVEGEKPPSLLIEIAEEPKSIDPATLVPAAVAQRVTVRFEQKPLRDIAKWLLDELSMTVLIDYPALADEGLLAGEPITDHLEDAPLYLLLNRLQSLQLGWYFEDETLYLTTKSQADQHHTTVPYNLGDLFDAGFRSDATLRAVGGTTGGVWEEMSGEGGASVLLGDVLFVRQSDAIHQEIAGLLAALRTHGRRTLTNDPPEHGLIREKLNELVTVEFDETPLNGAIKSLAEQVQADIRLDLPRLSDEGISERIPLSLKMTNRPLSTVLRALLVKSHLTWSFRDGVMWITTNGAAQSSYKTAVFDVRDLCQNQKESTGLMRAIHTQTRGIWDDADGEGGSMTSPKTGLLVVRQDERTLEELLKLLESYRSALRVSKPRAVAAADPQELVTRYYRLQREVAIDLEKLLPEMIQPDTWLSPARPEATGTIRSVTSRAEVLRAQAGDATSSAQSVKGEAFVMMANSVLIIRQTREIQESITKLIDKIQFGDKVEMPVHGMGGGGGGMGGGMGGGGMGGGGMGGGFGGGFFAIPAK